MKDSEFTFTFTADDEDNPMPEGSSGASKTATVKGSGEVEFGEIEFTKEGTYTYTVAEKKGNITGYEYDDTVYTVKYVVTDNNGELEVERTITAEGKNEEEAVFTNEYTAPVEPANPDDSSIAKTGDVNNMMLWIVLITLACMGLMGITIISRKKKNINNR